MYYSKVVEGSRVCGRDRARYDALQDSKIIQVHSARGFVPARNYLLPPPSIQGFSRLNLPPPRNPRRHPTFPSSLHHAAATLHHIAPQHLSHSDLFSRRPIPQHFRIHRLGTLQFACKLRIPNTTPPRKRIVYKSKHLRRSSNYVLVTPFLSSPLKLYANGFC
jgi:hypothetical protein